jgi:hypothetical protein
MFVVLHVDVTSNFGNDTGREKGKNDGGNSNDPKLDVTSTCKTTNIV